MLVSEAIGLEVVTFNGGSYTGAIMFTGWMYIGAAVFLWLVRAWKIGQDEVLAAGTEKNDDGSAAGVGTTERRSPFMTRVFMIRKA